MTRRAGRPIQFDLWGKPINEEPSRISSELIALDWETHAVRVIMIKGQPWLVAVDVCRALSISNHSQAVRGQRRRNSHGELVWSGGLDTDEWGLHVVYTPSGDQEMLVVNQYGALQLILKSNAPNARNFKRWLTHEVLPTLIRTGTYSVQRSSRIAQIARRLKTDRETAKIRCDQIDVNKASNARLAAEKAVPNQFREYHNACYRGQFGLEARDLRDSLGLKGHETPLDHMDGVVLSANHHAKVVSDRQIREREKEGRPVPLADQPAIVEKTSREVSAAVLEKLGREYIYGITQDPKRGLVLDVVRKQLAAS